MRRKHAKKSMGTNRETDYIDAVKKKLTRKGVIITQYSYQGPLGEVSFNRWYYFAWKDSHLIGTFKTFEAALESLAWKERPKAKREIL